MDDSLVEKLADDSFDPLTLTREELVGGIRRLTVANVATPVLCGSSLQNMAVQPLMDAIISYLPGPDERNIQVYVLFRGRAEMCMFEGGTSLTLPTHSGLWP